MKALSLVSLSLLTPVVLLAQQGAVGIGTTAPQAQLHTTASVRHDTMAGNGNRLVFADPKGNLFTPYSLSSQTQVSVPDNNCGTAGATSTINVTGQPATVPSANIRVRVNVTVMYGEDMLMYLVAPNGQRLRLMSNNGLGPNSFVNTVFWDGATATLPTGSAVGAPFTGAFKPTGGLNAICGITPDVAAFSALGSGSIAPNGIWTLQMFDDQFGGVNTLTDWAISFDGSTPSVNNTFPANAIVKGTGGNLAGTGMYEVSGNVGINTSTPHLKLDVVDGAIGLRQTNASNHLYLSHTGTTAWMLAGGAETGLAFGVGGSSSGTYDIQNYLFGMIISPSGNVGIGTYYPNASLQFSSTHKNRKVVLHEYANNDHEYSGFGTGGNFLRYQVPGPNDDHVFFSGAGTTASSELMRITGDGHVGIGTATPGTNAKLEIHGGAVKGLNNYYYMNNGGTGFSPAGGAQHYSLYASARIWCGAEINVTSDLRTKERVSSSMPAADLALVNRLRVVDYNYVDRATKGDTRVKGFIAQEVEAVMPDAVLKNTGVVPNIYRKAESVKYEESTATLEIVMKAAHPLKPGDTLKLITDDGDKLVPVVAVQDSLHFTVGGWESPTTWAFVYGTQVHDLRNLDYNKIFSAGISAIQELSREVTNLEKRVAVAEGNAADAKREVAELRTSVERLLEARPTAKR